MKHLYPSRGRLWSVYMLFLLLPCIQNSTVLAQNAPPTLQGIILSANGQEPLAGASIQIKGTTHGTLSNARGQFSLTVTERKIGLRVSFIGYYTLDTLVTTPFTKELVLSLRPDESVLEEVTVSTGYWESSKRLSTGNISKITAETIEKQPVTNVLQALQGRMAGVNITQRSGVPGGGMSIQIRGRNSLRPEGNNPLYVIDGVPFTSESLSSLGGTVIPDANPLNAINPSSIESVEILKDADATAIYGSRGANGVILITTKREHSTKTQVNVNLTLGVGEVPHKMKLLNTQQYVEMRKEAFANDKVKPQAAHYDLTSWDTTRYTDWQEVLLGETARTLNSQITVSGGSKNTNFTLGFGYHKESSVFPGDFKFQRGSAQLNIHHISDDKKFNLSVKTSFTGDGNNLPKDDITRQAFGRLAPNAPALYDQQGNLNWENSTWTNPMAYLINTYRSTNKNLVSNISASYQLAKGVELKANSGYNFLMLNEQTLFPTKGADPAIALNGGSANFSKNTISTWIAEPQISYDKTVGQGRLKLLVGSSFQQTLQQAETLNASGFSSDNLLGNIQAATNLAVLAASYSQYRYHALYSRINYLFKERYSLNLTARRDGSSRFGPGKQFANFGAVGAAWLFSEESWFSQIAGSGLINLGKLRFSYGSTGSDQIGNYGYLDSYKTTGIYRTAGLVPTQLVNPDYAWESNRKMELGSEFSMFNRALNLEVCYYRNRSSNQLVGYPLPAITGFPSVQYNLDAVVENTGWEFEIGFSTSKTKRISWKSNFNLTLPQNRLISYPNLAGSSYANSYVVGKPLSISKRYKSLDVDPKTGKYAFEDVDADGTITSPADRQELLNTGTFLFGGWQNTLAYKGFELHIFIHLVKQVGGDYRIQFVTPGMAGNQPIDVMLRWKSEGDISTVQKFTQNSSTDFNRWTSSDKALSDNSFGRLKNISLYWWLPKSILPGFSIQQSKIFLQGQNLATLTRYKGMDPENQGSFLPPLRIISAGFQLIL